MHWVAIHEESVPSYTFTESLALVLKATKSIEVVNTMSSLDTAWWIFPWHGGGCGPGEHHGMTGYGTVVQGGARTTMVW